MIFHILFIISIILLIAAMLYRILAVFPYAEGDIFMDFLFAVQTILFAIVLEIFIRMIINMVFGI